MDFARAIRGDDDDRGALCLDSADFGNGDLEIRQDLQQIGFERFIGSIQFVDEQHGRFAGLRVQCLQQRPADQEAFAEDVFLEFFPRARVFGFRHADFDHLALVIPFVHGRCDVQAFVALQADQLAAEDLRQHLGDLGLAYAGFAFQKQRPAHAQREKHRRRQRPLGNIFALREQGQGFVYRFRNGLFVHSLKKVKISTRRHGEHGEHGVKEAVG